MRFKTPRHPLTEKGGSSIAKVIVADENEGRRSLLANTLEREGFDITRAATLRQAEGTALAIMPEVVLIDGEWVGCFGEIDPAISQTFELLVPLNGAEFDVEALKLCITDPV